MAVVVAHGAGPTPSPAGTSPAPAPIVVVDDRGFDWADAGIGAVAALGLGGGLAGLVAIRRTQQSDVGSSS
jgi:hypothetical protein